MECIFHCVPHSLENNTYIPLQQWAADMQSGMMKIFTTLIHRALTQGKQVWHTCTQGITHLRKRKWGTIKLWEVLLYEFNSLRCDICIWYCCNSSAFLFIEHEICNRRSSALEGVWILRIDLTRCVSRPAVQKDNQRGRKWGLRTVPWGSGNSRFVLTQTQCYCTPKHVRNCVTRLARPKHH